MMTYNYKFFVETQNGARREIGSVSTNFRFTGNHLDLLKMSFAMNLNADTTIIQVEEFIKE